jgi:beta-lactamase class D
VAALALLLQNGNALAQSCPVADSGFAGAIEQRFAGYSAEGTFLLRNRVGQMCVVVNPDRAAVGYLPASTFKIFNTMVALDERSIPDEKTVIPWDGVDRGSPGWNQDQDMRTAFRRSTLWFYQELARRTGEDRMRQSLLREGYGNASIAGGIDQFWLHGGLRITAEEQVEVFRRLYARELGFSRRAQDIANALLSWEQTDTYTLYGKTGWTRLDGKQLGWLVGYVEKGTDVFFYALNLESADAAIPMREARESILRYALTRLGILEASD